MSIDVFDYLIFVDETESLNYVSIERKHAQAF